MIKKKFKNKTKIMIGIITFIIMIFIPHEIYFNSEIKKIKITLTRESKSNKEIIIYEYPTTYRPKVESKLFKQVNYGNDSVIEAELPFKNVLKGRLYFNNSNDLYIKSIKIVSHDEEKKINLSEIIKKNKNLKLTGENFILIPANTVVKLPKEFWRGVGSFSGIKITSIMFFLIVFQYIFLKEFYKKIFKNRKNFKEMIIIFFCLYIIFEILKSDYTSKFYRLFVYSFILYALLNIKKIKLNKYLILSGLLLMINLITNYFYVEEFGRSFDKLQFTIIIFMILLSLDLNKLERKYILNSIYMGLNLMMMTSLISPYKYSGNNVFPFAAWSMILVVISFGYLITLKSFNRGRIKILLYTMTFFFGMYGIFLANRRMTFVALPLTLVIMIFINNRKNFIKISLIMVILGFLVFMSLPKYYLDRFESIGNTTTNSSNVQRIVMWKIAVQITKDHPFFGIGRYNFTTVSKDKKYENINYKGRKYTIPHYHPHNEILDTSSSTGLVGLFIYLTFFLSLLKHLFNNYKNDGNAISIIIIGIFISIQIFGNFEPISFMSQGDVWWPLLAMGVAQKKEGN